MTSGGQPRSCSSRSWTSRSDVAEDVVVDLADQLERSAVGRDVERRDGLQRLLEVAHAVRARAVRRRGARRSSGGLRKASRVRWRDLGRARARQSPASSSSGTTTSAITCVDHQRDQLVLVADVVVERHRPGAEAAGRRGASRRRRSLRRRRSPAPRPGDVGAGVGGRRGARLLADPDHGSAAARTSTRSRRALDLSIAATFSRPGLSASGALFGARSICSWARSSAPRPPSPARARASPRARHPSVGSAFLRIAATFRTSYC